MDPKNETITLTPEASHDLTLSVCEGTNYEDNTKWNGAHFIVASHGEVQGVVITRSQAKVVRDWLDAHLDKLTDPLCGRCSKDAPGPICTGCRKHPDQLSEYVSAAADAGISPDDYVRREEGTYNRENGHFLCTNCYIKAGMPSSPRGWVAP